MCDDKRNGPRMEDSSGDGGSSKICRDYLRKVCFRGQRCKFFHPAEEEPPKQFSGMKNDVQFCHDFQNGLCNRNMCRFLHCSRQEEESYLQGSELPSYLMEQAIAKGQVPPLCNGDVPICKDFLLGKCSTRRGRTCKFRHISQHDYDLELGSGDGGPHPHSHMHDYDGPPCPPRYSPLLEPQYDCFPPDVKRARYEMHQLPPSEFDYRSVDLQADLHSADQRHERRIMEQMMLMEKDIEMLRKENTILRKENFDLRVTNEFLLDKVTTLRLSATATVAAVTVPAVSLATTIPVATSVPAALSHPVPITSDASVLLPPPVPPIMAVSQAPPIPLTQDPTLTAVTLSTHSLNPTFVTATSMAPQNQLPISVASGHLVRYPILPQATLR